MEFGTFDRAPGATKRERELVDDPMPDANDDCTTGSVCALFFLGQCSLPLLLVFAVDCNGETTRRT